MQAFILGVKERYRGLPLEEQLQAGGFEVTPVEGVDGQQWTDSEFLAIYSPRAAQIIVHRQLSRGEVACFVGHRIMLERFLATGQPWALLCEDDARIVGDLNPILETLPSLPPRRPVIVSLSSPASPVHGGTRIDYPGGALWRQPRAQHGSVAYLASRPAAEIALRAYRRRRVDSIPDWPFGWATRVEFWRADPDPVHHSAQGTGSLLHAQRREKLRGSPRSAPADVSIGLAQLTGLAALYGRLHGLPFGLLLTRDLAEGTARLRRHVRRSRGR